VNAPLRAAPIPSRNGPFVIGSISPALRLSEHVPNLPRQRSILALRLLFKKLPEHCVDRNCDLISLRHAMHSKFAANHAEQGNSPATHCAQRQGVGNARFAEIFTVSFFRPCSGHF
jgi:hypothetical protein